MDVKTAGRTVDLFEAFANARTPLTLTELSRLLDSPQSSCFNLVRALEARGFLYGVGSSKRLYPTRKLFDIASAIVEFEPVVSRISQRLDRVRDITNETVIFGARQNQRVVYLAISESRQTIRYISRAGELKPMHASAIGKALLMAMAPADRLTLVHQLPMLPSTDRTLTTAEALIAEIDAAYVRGYAETRGENVVDVMAVACPLRIDGMLYAAAVAGPMDRMLPHAAAHAACIETIFGESPI